MTMRQAWQFEMPLSVQVEVAAPEHPRAVLIAYHGYGQSALQLLDALVDAGIAQECLVVAPWGLHQYYDRRGDVVASWMTRFAREARVADLRRHAGALWAEIVRRHGELPLALFGFSQGAANVYRVGLQLQLPARQLYVLAGDMPPEVVDELATAPRRRIHLLWGEGDELLPLDRMRVDAARLAAAGFELRQSTAPGGHALLPALLAELRRGLGEIPRIGPRQSP